MSAPKFSDFLSEYLKAYWLRPVTAVVRSLESEIYNFSEFKGQQTLELACGDGTNGLIATGGTVPFEFDVFQSLPLVSAKDFFEAKSDVYNHFLEDKNSRFKFPRINTWTKGIDHKENLVKKANTMGCYADLEVRDLNLGLSEPKDKYDLIFSNSLYWIRNIDKLLTDIHECLKPGGVAKFSIIKNSFDEQMAWTKLKDYNFKKYVDMGRHKHYEQLVDEKTWENRFTKTGFDIVSKTPTFNKNLVHMIEFHDYREISPLTSFMANSLDPIALKEVKHKWIEYAEFMFKEMYQENFFKSTSNDSYYNIYTLKKV